MQKDISGAQVLARCLSSQGIKFFFTVPTPRLEPLLKALENEKDVRIITAHNETAAALMADGYIRRSRLQAAVLTDAKGRAISQISGESRRASIPWGGTSRGSFEKALLSNGSSAGGGQIAASPSSGARYRTSKGLTFQG